MNTITIIAAAVLITRGAAGQVTVEALGVTGELAKQRVPEFHVFASQPAALDLAVEAPLGAKVSLTADLFQIAKGIAAPLQAHVRMSELIDYNKQTRRLIHTSLPMPEVKRKTEILVRLQAQIEGEANAVRAGDVRLFIYPKELTKELAEFVAHLDRESGLAVFGESKRIRAFLKENQIPFSDCGEELPAEINKQALYLGEVTTGSLGPRENTAGARLIIFKTEPGTLPGVYVSTLNGGSITKVILPLLDNLATNPQSQQAFADLLQQSFRPNTP